MTRSEAAAYNHGVLAVLDVVKLSAAAITSTSKRPIAEGFAAAALEELAEAGLGLLIMDETGRPIAQIASEGEP